MKKSFILTSGLVLFFFLFGAESFAQKNSNEWDYQQDGGKTGSAEVSSGSPNAVFVAFAPYDDPQIAVAVVIEHGWHGGEAANVAKAIFDAYFFPEGTEAAATVGELVG